MRSVLFLAAPFVKEEVTLALEAGVDGLIVPAKERDLAASLARCRVEAVEEAEAISLRGREDEHEAARLLRQGRFVVLHRGWEIIPVENLLARGQAADRALEAAPAGGEAGEAAGAGGAGTHRPSADSSGAALPGTGTQGLGELALEVLTPEEARLAAGILERGVETVVVPPEGLGKIQAIVAAVKLAETTLDLCRAEVAEILPVGMGHRVCVDTLSILTAGQGMLVGNSAAFTFLVNAETERNEYVAARPFRINAGAVHAYAMLPGDRTNYLEELRAGSEVLIVDHTGKAGSAVVGRIKTERRPMLLVRARIRDDSGGQREGAVFLQNAETIRLVRPDGAPVSVVSLRVGDTILCRLDTAGRHFGMRITEDITEV